jgi:hypothetical protein
MGQSAPFPFGLIMTEKKRVFAHAQIKKKSEQDWPLKPELETNELSKQEFERQFMCNPKQEKENG